MITLTLPDGKQIEAESGSTLGDVARKIGPGLAKAALAGRMNGRMMDLATPLTEGGEIQLLTWDSDEGREIFWHTTSHILAQAVMRLYPKAKLTIGPPIAEGFYYDIDFGETVSVDDLPRIEAEMKKIIEEDFPSKRVEITLDEARERYAQLGNSFKVELLDDLQARGEQRVTYYEQGEFFDLCRGPHLPSTGKVRAFKLLSVAGAYWRGDEKNPMLTRIYGISFPDRKQLDEYLRMLEEAKKRDHRKIGRELGLFAFHDEAPGFPFFMPNGVILYNTLIDEIRRELRKRGYVEIKTPIILNEELWHRSGHWDHYKENMYFTEIDERDYAVKPMNCPGGLLVFNQDLHSYRDLPLRVAEFGLVHRHEKSGVLHGLFRVRCFTQDDAHVFCTEEHLEDEIRQIIELIHHVYDLVGFKEYNVELSTRPDNSIGSDEIWDKATTALRHTLEKMEINYKLNPGDGAFYGPKIDFHVKDCLGRTWQCGTIQADFSMPERFDLNYVGVDGQKHRPVMVHRAIFGSIERFLGILIEHWAGDFPLWLAPVQAIVLPVSGEQHEYARQLRSRFEAAGIRTQMDLSEEKIGKKIREAELRKIPMMLVVGAKEVESGQVSVRRRHVQQQSVLPVEEVISAAIREIESRAKTAEEA